MAIVFFCPSCEAKLRIATRKAGQQISCPKCAQPLIVPVPARKVEPVPETEVHEPAEAQPTTDSAVQEVLTDSDGTEAGDATEEMLGDKSPEAPADLTCPWCRGMDKVRRVSTIVRHGTILGKTSTDANRAIQNVIDPDFVLPDDEASLKKLERFSQTSLAQRLSPSAPPKKSSIRKWLLGFACAAVFVFALAVIAAAMDGSGTLITVLFVLAIMFGAVAFIIGQKIPAVDEADQQRMEEWETEVGQWRNSYYCGRCDRTFVQ
jgi:hypothetical protein